MMPHWLLPTSFFLLLLLLPAHAADPASITIRGQQPLDYVDDHFICATLDWWPPDKCDYGSCSWDHASLLNLNLTHPLLRRAVKAFSPLKIRLGGSLQDKVIYDVGHPLEPCTEFSKSPSSLFGFSNGCLPMSRWDELHNFFQETEPEVVFGLNALYGRTKKGTHYTGPWNSSNTQDFIQYTVDHGYKMDAWEFGNELSGSGVGTSISAVQYAADVKELRRIIEQIYKEQPYRPLVIAPDGFLDEQWFKDFLQEAGASAPDIVSHHIYNLGAGVDPNLVTKILNPSYLDKENAHFQTLQDIISESGSKASSWVGEAGGAYNSGQHLVTDAFVSSFWYVDQLGMAARYGTKCYCRQSLIGGNYGLLNTTTFEPNPDYYSALLWHRLMGQKVLAVQVSSVASSALSLRTYAHCSKNMDGITLVLLNFSNQTKYYVTASIQPSLVSSDAATLKSTLWSPEIVRAIKSYWRMENPQSTRLEYHLSAGGGSIHSQAVNLNGASLRITKDGDIPGLVPNTVDSSLPISLSPLSIAFVQFPGQFLACTS